MDVVTGAAGFIGSHLVRSLLADGRPVIGIDSFDPFYARSVKERNLAPLLPDSRFRFVPGDLVELDLDGIVPSGARVFHLAGQPGVSGSWGDQFGGYARNNILATQRLLEVLRRKSPTAVIYGGSSSVYGLQPDGPMSETAVPAPISPYGVTKLAGEHLCRLYGHAYGLPVIALRFFSVYGPGQRPDMVFHRFIRALLQDRPVTVTGDGSQARDFTYIDDIITGLRRAAESSAFGRTINLGAGTPTRLRDVLRLLEPMAGRPADIEPAPVPPGDPTSTWADASAAEKELGFRPRTPLKDGLRRQWDWQAAEHETLPPS